MICTHSGYGLSPAMPIELVLQQAELCKHVRPHSAENKKRGTGLMSQANMSAVWAICEVLHGQRTPICYETVKVMPGAGGYTRNTISRCLFQFAQDGFLERRTKRGRNNMVIYKLARQKGGAV